MVFLIFWNRANKSWSSSYTLTSNTTIDLAAGFFLGYFLGLGAAALEGGVSSSSSNKSSPVYFFFSGYYLVSYFFYPFFLSFWPLSLLSFFFSFFLSFLSSFLPLFFHFSTLALLLAGNFFGSIYLLYFPIL